jgi:hypothetical protein
MYRLAIRLTRMNKLSGKTKAQSYLTLGEVTGHVMYQLLSSIAIKLTPEQASCLHKLQL